MYLQILKQQKQVKALLPIGDFKGIYYGLVYTYALLLIVERANSIEEQSISVRE